MMKVDRRTLSAIFLIIGLVCLMIGFSTDNTIFSWAAVIFVLISLLTGGRWMRGRKQK